jgi:broad specificity phosphatase PhoE
VELILVRHALPVRARGVNGAAADPGLADEGHQQAQRVAGWLALARGEFYGCADPEQFRQQVLDGMERLIDAHPGRRVAAFSHAGTINVYVGHVPYPGTCGSPRVTRASPASRPAATAAAARSASTRPGTCTRPT